MEPLAVAAASAGFRALFGTLSRGLAKIYKKAAHAHLKESLASWATSGLQDTVHSRADSVRWIKTLWRVEQKMDLMDFYSRPHIKSGKARWTVEDYDSLKHDGNVLIQGTVGQGKSMLLRYMTIRELASGARLPVFVELRLLKPDEPLLSHVVKKMNLLGLVGTDESVFEHLAGTGRVLLLLDGFDEIAESDRSYRAQEIDSLLLRNPELRAVVTSRPHSGIQSLPSLRVFQLSHLENNEYENVLRRIVDDAEMSNAILIEIRDREQVIALLTTPLMVTLLAVQFRSDHRIPDTKVAFFRGLFGLVLSGHDRSKLGYKRPRKTSLSDARMEEAFNALCFYLNKDSADRSYDRSTISSYASKALKYIGSDVDAGAYVDDVSEITCLLLYEGTECSFVHRSVCEFHAACFVRALPDLKAAAFYRAAIDGWEKWESELEFLSQLDSIRYLKYFKIPDATAVLEMIGDSQGAELALKVFGQHVFIALRKGHIGLNNILEKYLKAESSGRVKAIFGYRDKNGVVRGWIVPPMKASQSEWLPPQPTDARVSELCASSDEGVSIPFGEIVSEVSDEGLREVERYVADLQTELQKAVQAVERYDVMTGAALEGL